MTYAEHEQKSREAHEAFKRAGGYSNPEACAAHKRFQEETYLVPTFRAFTDKVADRVIAENGFKLSKAQRSVVAGIIHDMVLAKLGREWVLNHYEYHRNPDRTVHFCFDNHFDKGIYFARMNTRTLEKLAGLGILEIVEVGGRWSDDVKPCFDFDLIEKF